MSTIYKNGNYSVYINKENGTKIRIMNDRTGENEFKPEFPESIDMTITYECDGGCEFCYAGCNINGCHCDFDKYDKFIDSLPPNMEIAINGNDLSHPGLIKFLKRAKEKQLIVNMTVNQKHFMKYEKLLLDWYNSGLFKGLGISLTEPNREFCKAVVKFPTAIIHVITGIFSIYDYGDLLLYTGGKVKLLILGYKYKGRGEKYFDQNYDEITKNIRWLRDSIDFVIDAFDTVAFDNNALDRLDIKDMMIKKGVSWDKFYMGDEGQFTFFVDLVKGVFAVSSSEMDSSKFHEIKKDMTIKEMFAVIRGEQHV